MYPLLALNARRFLLATHRQTSSCSKSFADRGPHPAPTYPPINHIPRSLPDKNNEKQSRKTRRIAPILKQPSKDGGGSSGTCVEASWHGSRVSVKQLLAPSPQSAANGGGRGRSGGGGGGGRLGWARTGGLAPRVVSAAAASAIRREVRLLQALGSEFLVPIYGVRQRENRTNIAAVFFFVVYGGTGGDAREGGGRGD